MTFATIKKEVIKVSYAIFFIFYILILITKIKAYASGSDSSGYLNAARLLASGKFQEKQRIVEGISYPEISEYAYIPLGFIPTSNTEMAPSYPLGLPILIAAASFFSDLILAPHIIMFLHAIGSLILMYLIAREVKLEKEMAMLATIMLALSPLFLYLSTWLMSDMPAMFWNSAAILAALKSYKNQTKNSEAKYVWAIAAGLLTGFAVMVRPTNIFIIFPIVIILTPSLEGHLKLNWKSLICFGLGGLPLAILLGVFNFYLYGRIFSTGYEKTFLNYQTFTKIFNINYGVEPFSLFAWQFAPLSVKNYLETLPSILTPASILLLGLLSPKLWRKNRRTFLIMTSWMIMFFGFYAFYFCTHTEWWYMRFILPAFPAIIIVILITFQTLLDKLEPAMQKIALYVFTIFILAWSFYASFNLFNLNEKVYFEAAEYAKENLSQDSIMVTMQTSGSLLHYTNLAILRYDNAEIDDIKKIQKAAIKAKRPIYALLFPHEEKVAKNRISGKWKKLKEIENCTLWCVNC